MLETYKWLRAIQKALNEIPEAHRQRMLQLALELNNLEKKIEDQPEPKKRGRPPKKVEAMAVAMKTLGWDKDETPPSE